MEVVIPLKRHTIFGCGILWLKYGSKLTCHKDVSHRCYSEDTEAVQVLSIVMTMQQPSLTCLTTILAVLVVTAATVERSFSSMKLIKTRLRIRMGEILYAHLY